MLRLLVYWLLFGASSVVLYALATWLLLPERVYVRRELSLAKSREELYYFLRDAQYFPLWQVFETGIRFSNKYQFRAPGTKGAWTQVVAKKSQSFTQVELLEDRPLQSLKLRYHLRDLEYPLDLSINLADAADSVKSVWAYEIPLRASFWDLMPQAWLSIYQFYKLHQLFDKFIPSLKHSLHSLNIAVPFKLSYQEQKLAPTTFWIYAEDSLSNAAEFEQHKARLLQNYWQNRPYFIRNNQVYLQRQGNSIRVGQLLQISVDSLSHYAQHLQALGAGLRSNRVDFAKSYRVRSFAFAGSSADLLDSLHRRFPNTLIKSKNSLTLEQIYRGENQKNPFRSHKSWVHLSKF